MDLRAHTALLVLGGSRAYGLHTADSDVDVKGMAIPPASHFHGMRPTFEQADRPEAMACFVGDLGADEQAVAKHTKLEGTVYEIRKVMRLAAEGNPNILDLLFCREQEVRLLRPAGAELRAHRELFLSTRCRHTFTGYANAQLKRIRGHRAWLLHPPTHEPVRSDFGLPETTLLPADQLAAARAAVEKRMDSWNLSTELPPHVQQRVEDEIATMMSEIRVGVGLGEGGDPAWLAAARGIGLDANLVHVLQQERAYEAARRGWTQYQAWVRGRNPARAALEARWGYDTKHGAHLVRLLRMGREILETGLVHVWRGDRDGDELLAIRNGAWSYDRLLETAEREQLAIAALADAGRSAVPAVPDVEAIDTLCQVLVEGALRAADPRG